MPECVSTEAAPELPGSPVLVELDDHLAAYTPHVSRMSTQLQQTSKQIEDAVMEVCGSFGSIAERARATVAQTVDLVGESSAKTRSAPSFDQLIRSCGSTMRDVMQTTTETAGASLDAIGRIRQIDQTADKIANSMRELHLIAEQNKMLALNARIEAAHAGQMGAGFAVVAMEVESQTKRTLELSDHVGQEVETLRTLADSTLREVGVMATRSQDRVTACRAVVDSSLDDLRAAHLSMKEMISRMSHESSELANDIGSAVRGLQFQDRISQRLAHVTTDLDALHMLMQKRFRHLPALESAEAAGFSAYTMQEEREAAGITGSASGEGDVELF